MEKLEFKHIAPYLPFKVKVRDVENNITWELHPYKDCLDNLQTQDFISVRNFIEENKQHLEKHGKNCHKLVLRPLSDLIEVIKHNETLFKPSELLLNLFKNSMSEPYVEDLIYGVLNNYDFKMRHLEHFSYGVIQKLHEWHFDTEGLIEKGLAIDINTLNHD